MAWGTVSLNVNVNVNVLRGYRIVTCQAASRWRWKRASTLK